MRTIVGNLPPHRHAGHRSTKQRQQIRRAPLCFGLPQVLRQRVPRQAAP